MIVGVHSPEVDIRQHAQAAIDIFSDESHFSRNDVVWGVCTEKASNSGVEIPPIKHVNNDSLREAPRRTSGELLGRRCAL